MLDDLLAKRKLSIESESTDLKSTNQIVVNFFLEQVLSFAIFARPAPHILAFVVLLARMQNCSTNCPHNDTKSEKGDGEESIIHSSLFGPFMAASPVAVENQEAKGQ